MSESARELNIFTADFCNFSCGHCIANSSPGSKNYKINMKEITALSQLIERSADIQQIHFVGGEPTLQLKMIEALQHQVSRPVKYAMTTNGWFASSPGKILDRIKLHEIRISYDRFHADFIDEDKIKSLLQYCVGKGLKTILKLTVETGQDVLTYSHMLLPQVELLLSKLEVAGKARDIETKTETTQGSTAFWDLKCPSLASDGRGLETVVFFPGKGLTSCCSNLVFNESGDSAQVFSNLENSFEATNQLRTKLNFNFRSAAEALKIDTQSSAVRSACEACELLFGKIQDSQLPSLATITEKAMQEPFVSAITAAISDSHLQLLDKNFRVFYQLSGSMPLDMENALQSERLLLESGLSVRDHEASEVDFLMSVESDLMKDSEAQMTAGERAELEPRLRDYIQACTQRFVYYQNQKPVAALFVWDGLPHPQIQEKVTHIGVLGIGSEVADKKMRQAIRLDFSAKLQKISQGKLVVGKIAAINKPALRHAARMGRSPVFAIVEKRKS